MRKEDLKHLIDSFLYKIEEKAPQYQRIHAISKEVLDMFYDWCVQENLFME